MTAPSSVTFVLGPLLIGVILNAILYGVCVVQCFIYYQTYKRDATWIRYFVLYLFVMETFNTIFDIGMVFEPLVLLFGEEEAFSRTPTMIIPDAIVTVMLSTPVQFFIAWRIKIVSGSLVMPLIIAFFGTTSFLGGLAVTILAPIVRERAKLERVLPALITWLASSATADVLITLSLSWALFKRKTGMKSTDDQISRIILLTVQTGFLTTLFAVADVAVFLITPTTNINFVFDLALSKLCTNSLLSTLNARAGWNNLTGTNNNGDANVLFGQMASRTRTELTKSAFSRDTTRTDVIELDERDTKADTLDGGIRVHKVVQHY